MIKSGYSFRTAFGHLADVHNRVIECEYPAAPIADRNSCFAMVKWNKLCKKANIKPVFGVELGVTEKLGEKPQTLDHWTFLAIDQLRPLHDLVALATSNPGKEPSLTYAQAMAATGVYKIAGHTAQLQFMEPQNELYVGLTPACSKGFVKSVREGKFQFCAKSDNVYPRQSDLELYRVALGWRSGTQTYPRHILTKSEWIEATKYVADSGEQLSALLNQSAILKRCNAQLKTAELLKPEREKSLRQLCEEGATRLDLDLTDPVYRDRLNTELKLIEDKEFEDYFRIVADLVVWAKRHMLVGPARGSSCGSLVCYLLNITSVDPLKFSLIFQRFVDVNRGGWFFDPKFLKELGL